MKNKTKLIGIVGGSCSGKTVFADHLNSRTHGRSMVLSQDNYYRGLGGLESADTYNFDHPDALDLPRLQRHLASLRDGNSILMPVYDFTSHKRQAQGIEVVPPEIVIVEGLFLFSYFSIRNLFDLKIFFDVPREIRLNRRLERDVITRGRSRDEVVQRFNEHCEPAYREFISPSSIYADLKITPAAGFGPLYDKQVSNVIDRVLEK